MKDLGGNEMERLDFLKPEMHRGLNYTVRLGDKWMKRLEVGNCVFLGKTEAGVVGQAAITEILYVRAEELPPRVYKYEHDQDCSTQGGLRQAMIKAYPEMGGANLWEIFVTAIGFVPIASGDIPFEARPFERERVYDIIDGEIDYAKSQWDAGLKKNSWPDKDKPVECWLMWMDTYLAMAKTSTTRSADKNIALDNVRKLTGLAVNCMTYHPVRSREAEMKDKIHFGDLLVKDD